MNCLHLLRHYLLAPIGLVGLFFDGPLQAQSVTVLPITAPWRYTTNNLDVIPWTTSAYNDTAWSGPGSALLYIEATALPAPKNTALPTNAGTALPWRTYYFRTSFTLTNLTGLWSVTFSNLLDDGAVYYLNGVEINRLRMNTGSVLNATFANLSVDNATNYDVFTLVGAALTNFVEGTNVLAVEVHQINATSSDVVFGASLSALYGRPHSALTRGPYLQSSTTNSIVIRWRTDVAVDSRVIYGTNLASLEFTNLDLSIGTEHIVTLTNLLPDTRYYYAVGDAVTNLAGLDANHFFLTHPLPQSTKDLRVWVIGDAGTKNANQQAVRNAFTNFNGTNLVHAWLQLGDNAYDNGTDAEHQAAVFNMYPMLLRNSVTWPALGNHDTAQGTAYVDTYPYFDIFTLPTAGEAGGAPSGTEHYYSFDLGMAHFICLDSMTASRATNGAMATWLRSDLAMNSNRWAVAFWHHPPYTKGSHDSDAEAQLGAMRTNFLPILEAGGVDLVLAGHSHCYERSYLLNGHYGTSGNFNSTNVVQPGSGRETNGVGAYLKPDGLGESPVGNRGAIYIVAGSSGQATGGALNHVAMFTSQNVLGSMVLDFYTNRLEAIFLPTNGVPTDWFTIIKQGTYPPQLTNTSMLPGGELQFTVLSRAYRTNIIEATSNLVGPGWTAIATNQSTNAAFEVLDSAAPGFTNRFYRVRRP